MEPIENKLARYYRGESSLEDEQALKNAYRKGELPSEPALSYGGDTAPCPEEVFQAIRHGIGKRKTRHSRRIFQIAGGIAATLLLIIGLRAFLPAPSSTEIQLSEQVQRERFEDALRVIANVLNEQITGKEKIVYEDNDLIIAIE